MSPGARLPLLSSLMGTDGSGEVLVLGDKVGSSVDLFLGLWAPGWDPRTGFFLLNRCGRPPCRRSPPGVLEGA